MRKIIKFHALYELQQEKEMASKRKVEQDTEQDESIAPKIPKSDVRSNENTSTESWSKTCDDDKKSDILHERESIAAKIPKSDGRSGVSTSKEWCSKTCENDKKNVVLYERETSESERETIQNKIISTGLKETSHYEYIDTEGKLSIAIEEIRQAMQKGATIAVDCEGVELSRFGSVTLINIAVRGQVYLIDVLKIGSVAYDRGLVLFSKISR